VPDAIPSDHPTVDSLRVECSQIGRTGRLQLLLPGDLSGESGAAIRLHIEGTTAYTAVVSTLDGEFAIQGAYANRRRARTEEGTDLLQEWLESNGYGPESTLVLDVLTDGYGYGLREPGDRVVYEPTDSPNSSLAEIAQSIEREDRDG
jgi:hypothetical protein